MLREPVQRKLYYVLKKYGIYPTQNVELSYFSMANEVFIIRYKGGKVLLKNCRSDRDFRNLTIQTKLMKHLNKKKVRCPKIIKTTDNKEIVEYNRDYFMMFEFLKGQTLTWNSKLRKYHIIEATKGLAHYHKAVKSFDPDIDTNKIKSYNYKKHISLCNKLLHSVNNNKTKNNIRKSFNEIADDIIFFADRLNKYLPSESIDSIDHLMVHGDFHAGNCIFRDKKYFACYDFDFIHRDIKIFDICWSMRMYAKYFYIKHFGNKIYSKKFKPSKKDIHTIETKKYTSYIKTYSKYSTISNEEIFLLPGMEVSLFLNNLRFFNLKNSEEECIDHIRWYKWTIRNIKKYYSLWQKIIDDIIKNRN